MKRPGKARRFSRGKYQYYYVSWELGLIAEFVSGEETTAVHRLIDAGVECPHARHVATGSGRCSIRALKAFAVSRR